LFFIHKNYLLRYFSKIQINNFSFYFPQLDDTFQDFDINLFDFVQMLFD